MLGLPSCVKILLYAQTVDMRMGHDGLRMIVQNSGGDAFCGHVFVFLSKRRDRIKILWWDHGGFALYYKRLEKGRFQQPQDHGNGVMMLDHTQLSMLLDGINISHVQRQKKWHPHVEIGSPKSS